MQVILLERVAKLGQMGEVVRVKDGYARNFLLPRGKALRATEANRRASSAARRSSRRATSSTRTRPQQVAEKLDGQSLHDHPPGRRDRPALRLGRRPATSPRSLTAGGFSVDAQQIALNTPIKSIGLHEVPISLHPEVEVTVTINVARSPEEAERQARGEDLTRREEGPAFETYDPEADEAAAPAEPAPAPEGEER